MDYYDDPKFSYPDFWTVREYEHCSELLALRALLRDTHATQAADIGGGFGRLTEALFRYSENVVLVEPSIVQREIAKQSNRAHLRIQCGTSEETGLATKSQDLVIMVRVMHHIPNPDNAIGEIKRVLKPGGLFVLEFANALHLKARIKNWMRLRGIPLEPTPVNSAGDPLDIPFVNHHPETVKHMLEARGFIIEQTLSVSNFRSPLLKKLLPLSLLLSLERLLQRPLSYIYFGPSIFILVRRTYKA